MEEIELKIKLHEKLILDKITKQIQWGKHSYIYKLYWHKQTLRCERMQNRVHI